MQSEMFWVTASFLVFVIFVGVPVWRKIAAGLDKRSDRIKQELDEAVKLREEAQALLVSFQRKQREAMQEADHIIKQARENAAVMMAEAEKELEDTLNKRIQIAMERIEQAESTALDDVKAHAIDIAVAASNKLLREHVDKKMGNQLFETALKDIQKKLH